MGENFDCDDGRGDEIGFDDDWPLDDAIEDDVDEEDDEFLGFLAGDFAADSDFLSGLFGL